MSCQDPNPPLRLSTALCAVYVYAVVLDHTLFDCSHARFWPTGRTCVALNLSGGCSLEARRVVSTPCIDARFVRASYSGE